MYMGESAWFDGVVELDERNKKERPLTGPGANRSKDLENASPFRLHKRSNYPPLTAFVNKLFREMAWPDADSKRGKARQNWERRTKHNLRSVVIDVIAKYEEDSTQYSAFSRNKNDYASTAWLNKAGITADIIICVDVLVEHGYLESVKGFRYENCARRSRIRATYKLIERLREQGGSTTALYLSIEDMVDAIRLKDENKKYIPYEDTEYITSARNVLLSYNAMMSHCTISHTWRYLDYAPLQKTQLYRVFNNGSWEQGGRYAGAAYQHMRKSDRLGLLIDGQQVVELDYSAAFPTLFYNLEGHDCWGQFGNEGDPYKKFLYEPGNEAEVARYRNLNKKILNTFLMAKAGGVPFESTVEKTRQAVQQELNDSKKHSDKEKRVLYPDVCARGYSLGNYIKEFLSRLHGMLELTAIDGMFLMYVESEIATRIMEACTILNKPILIIHDSFLVKSEDHEFLLRAMEDSWSEVVCRYSKDKERRYKCRINKC